ncbi:MAG TPA: ShlB/FhaC/HecB family hemolysin secretion/activation protein [Ramlibacter sp.]|nr:ShlB/FhaC/HecB family hemolysin secretion/activation protein [Ramlibacter sp.]
MFALTAIAAASAALAQAPAPAGAPAAPPMPASVPPPTFAIKGFKINGENPLGDAETQRILAPYVRNDATIETLQQASGVLEKSLRDRGFGLHRVALPPQEVGSTVTLNIVKFTIAKVDIDGRKIYSEANVRRTLPELQEGSTPNFSRLAIQTAIANENPNKQIQVGLKESEDIDKIDATIVVKEEKPWNIGMGISNAGTANSGRDRFTVTGTHTNLWDLDHQFTGAYTTSLQRPSDVQQIGLSYKAPLYALGSVVGVNFTKSDVVGNFGTFTSTGAGYTLGASYTHYLAPEGGRRSYFSFGIEDKLFKGTEVSGVVVGTDRRSVPVTVGYTARAETDTYVFGYDVALAVNTGLGSHDDFASYQQENKRITQVHWKALRGNVSYLAPFATAWLLTARGSWQLSPDVLISGEQFGLGGLGSVRGTEIDRPITADSGVSGTIEAMTPEVLTGLRFLGFVDGGVLWNQKPNGSDKPSNDHLMSVGLGLRYVKDAFSLAFDYGHIVVGSRVDPAFNSAAPKKGEHRFYVNAQIRF